MCSATSLQKVQKEQEIQWRKSASGTRRSTTAMVAVCIKGKPCPQKDDATEIIQKIIDSDVIVMATPVYFYTMSAQMKTLIDRTCARYMEIENKEFYFIMTASDPNKSALKRTLESLRGFTSCLSNVEEKGVVYGTGLTEIGDVQNSSVLEQAYEMGKKI